MQQIVYYVAGYEASPFFYRCFRLECEFGCKIEVTEQTYKIADCVGDININDKFKQQVDSIMDYRRYTSYYCKSDELYSNEFIPKTFNFADLHLYVCKELYLLRRFRLLLLLFHTFLLRNLRSPRNNFL